MNKNEEIKMPLLKENKTGDKYGKDEKRIIEELLKTEREKLKNITKKENN